MKSRAIKLLVLLFLTASSYSQTQNELLAAELDTFILNQMSLNSIPGLSASIVKEGQTVWQGHYGMANIGTATPVTATTKFTLASISKLFTATAVAKLWEEGSLDIDADINTYLPITIVNPNFPTEAITARQLLLHKSSLKDYETDLQLWDAPGDPIMDLATFCSDYFVNGGSLYLTSNFATTAPGASGYWYSNAGYTLLGYLVEVVIGLPFNEYCNQTILTPLEMISSGWFYSEVDSMNIAMPYNLSLEPYGYYAVPEYPAAMLKSSVGELSNFLIAYTQMGKFNGFELLNPATFSSMVPADMTNGFAWWGTDTWWGDPLGNFWSHGGYMNGVRTQLNYYPGDSTGLIILTNGEGSYSQIQQELEAYIPLFETDNATGLNDNQDHLKGMRVYPNPVSRHNDLTIGFEEGATEHLELLIQDLAGNTLIKTSTNRSSLSMNASRKTTVNISDLPSGLYLLTLRSKTGSMVYKVAVH